MALDLSSFIFVMSLTMCVVTSFLLIRVFANEDRAPLLMVSSALLEMGFAVILLHIFGLHPMICIHCDALAPPQEWIDLNTPYNLLYAEISVVAGCIFFMMFIWNKLRTPDQPS